jgi:hypothetical protein
MKADDRSHVVRVGGWTRRRHHKGEQGRRGGTGKLDYGWELSTATAVREDDVVDSRLQQQRLLALCACNATVYAPDTFCRIEQRFGSLVRINRRAILVEQDGTGLAQVERRLKCLFALKIPPVELPQPQVAEHQWPLLETGSLDALPLTGSQVVEEHVQHQPASPRHALRRDAESIAEAFGRRIDPLVIGPPAPHA